MSVVVEQVRDPLNAQRVAQACALWRAHQVLDEAGIEQRAKDIVVVAIDTASDRVVGIGTSYLATPERLQLPMWVYRTFVDPSHRTLAVYQMWQVAYRYHEDEFLSGREPRARGIYVEVQNKAIQAEHDELVWRMVGLTYIGPGGNGADCRVAYFKGARIRGGRLK